MFLLTTMGNHVVKEGFQDIKKEIKRAQTEKDLFIYLTNEDDSKCILQLGSLCLGVKTPDKLKEVDPLPEPSKIIKLNSFNPPPKGIN